MSVYNMFPKLTIFLVDYGGFYSKNSKITEQLPGEGHGSIAGAQGTMWTTALQIGELIDTAQRVSHDAKVDVFFMLTFWPSRLSTLMRPVYLCRPLPLAEMAL